MGYSHLRPVICINFSIICSQKYYKKVAGLFKRYFYHQFDHNNLVYVGIISGGSYGPIEIHYHHLNTVQKSLGFLRVIFYHICDHQICHFVWMMNNHLDIVMHCLVVPMASQTLHDHCHYLCNPSISKYVIFVIFSPNKSHLHWLNSVLSQHILMG